jgi:hypothetical protein
MKKFLSYWLMASSLWISTGTLSAQALPGDTVDEVKAWMQGHPTLRATAGERLLVRRADTPSRRFTFQASIFPIGRLNNPSEGDSPPILQRNRVDFSTVRNERFTLIDMINGVDLARLEESLRILYGPDVYADYRRAQATYVYPDSSPTTLLRPRRNQARGEVRDGAQFAYWVELIPNPDGTVQTGTISVLLREDLDSLQSYLQTINP